jgi:cytochrome c peroxidase
MKISDIRRPGELRRKMKSSLANRVVEISLAVSLLGGAGCSQLDQSLCENGNCGWSATDSHTLASLSDLPEKPPVDTSNKYFANPAAEQLGRKFFWDTRFSGVSTGADSLKRPVPYGRAPKGQPLNIACVTCHDLRRGGVDPATIPGNVSVGAGWDNTNSPTVFNDAYRPLILWAARADSLWAQPPGSIENSMGSNRLRATWTIATYYRADYEALFTEWAPMPMMGTIASVTPMLETTGALAGQCHLNPDCPAACRSVADSTGGTGTGCFPRFPLDGKPGGKKGCQPGDASEPFGDAWDCMAPADQLLVQRVVVNFAKAIAAFESLLISRNSAFDQFVTDMRAGRANGSTAISSEAKNGARLFVGKAGCSDCHSGPLLASDEPFNIGVPQTGAGVPTMDDCPKGGVCDCVTPNNCVPFGAFDGLQKLKNHAYLRTSMWSDNPQDDSRAKYVSADPASIPKGSWRVPSLRDVALTAPYMHTGAFATLEEVVAHYNRGAEPMPNGSPSARLQPLYLSDREQAQLVEFLKTLTGEPLPAEIADPPTLP